MFEFLRRRAGIGLSVLLVVICGCATPRTLDFDRYRGKGFRDNLSKESSLKRTQDIDSDGPASFSTRARQIEKNLGY